MKTLNLTLKKKWFDLIKQGIKYPVEVIADNIPQ